MKIAAIVVTYFPSEKQLGRLLSGMRSEVEKLYVVDNTPAGAASWLNAAWFAESGFDVEYCPLGDNLGIAKAQNVGIKLAAECECDHAIFFDQDSAPPSGMIKNLAEAELELLKLNIKVGSVGPIFRDEKTGEYSPALRQWGIIVKKIKIGVDEAGPVEADHLISSGSLIRISVLHDVGDMREDLFIDWVDIEWGLRARNLNYRNFIVPGAVMLHSIGDEFATVGTRKINLHNDVRNYYIVRNACYLLLDRSIKWQWRVHIFLKIPKFVVFYSLTTSSKQPWKAFVSLLRACCDGFAGRLGRAF